MVNWSLTKVPWSFSEEKEVFQEMLWNNGINMLEGEFLCLRTLKLLFGIWTWSEKHLATRNSGAEFITVSLWSSSCVTSLHSQEIKSYHKRKEENQWPSAICHRTNITVYVCSKKKKVLFFFNVYLERDRSY